MKRLILVALSALALSGCATSPKKVAVCDGKHRRAANIYGTVLPALSLPVPPSEHTSEPQPASELKASPGPSPDAPGTAAPAESSAPGGPAVPNGAVTGRQNPRTSLREPPAYFPSC